jgi:hypothetical protein
LERAAVSIFGTGLAFEVGFATATGLACNTGLAFTADFLLAAGGVNVAIRRSFFPDDLCASVDGLATFVVCLLAVAAGLLASVTGFLAFVTTLLSPKPGVAASNAIPTARLRIRSRFMTD